MARWRRVAMVAAAVAVAGGIGFLLWRWGAPVWAVAFVALVVLAVASRRTFARSGAAGVPAEPVSSENPGASDAYSDLQLGRLPPTYPVHDPRPISLVDDRPRDDLLPPEQP